MNIQFNPKTLAKFAESHDASEDFVRVLMTGNDGRHLARRKTALALENGRELPRAWGGFMTALWQGKTEKAWARADAQNSKLMRDAGIAPIAQER